ncbi:hypothetical protein [Sphingobacterium sp.]
MRSRSTPPLPCPNAYDAVCGRDEVLKSNGCLFCLEV